MNGLCATDIDIAHFGIYEPSLNDIFVASAGDEETGQDEKKEAADEKGAAVK